MTDERGVSRTGPAHEGGPDRIRALRQGRRLALAAVFEADFGQRTATAILERHLTETESDPRAADLARRLVAGVVDHPTATRSTPESWPSPRSIR